MVMPTERVLKDTIIGNWKVLEDRIKPGKIKCLCLLCKKEVRMLSLRTFKQSLQNSCGCESRPRLISRLLESNRQKAHFIPKGTIYNHWKVLEDSYSRSIKCLCIGCNTTIKQCDRWQLIRQQTKSCGCMKMAILEKHIDLAKQEKFNKREENLAEGTLFGYWKITNNRLKNTNNVECFCTGCNITTKLLDPHALLSGSTKSCGCQKVKIYKKNSLENYGVEHPGHLKETKDRRIKTCLERFGTKYSLQAPEVKQKQRETLYKNGTTPTSKQQVEIFNLFKEAGYEVRLNFPIQPYSIDIFLEIDDKKIAIEYDGGGHWVHAPEEEIKRKDRIRDEYFKKQGILVFRIESRKDVLPTLEQLKSKIKILLTTPQKKFVRLKLPQRSNS